MVFIICYPKHIVSPEKLVIVQRSRGMTFNEQSRRRTFNERSRRRTFHERCLKRTFRGVFVRRFYFAKSPIILYPLLPATDLQEFVSLLISSSEHVEGEYRRSDARVSLIEHPVPSPSNSLVCSSWLLLVEYNFNGERCRPFRAGQLLRLLQRHWGKFLPNISLPSPSPKLERPP